MSLMRAPRSLVQVVSRRVAQFAAGTEGPPRVCGSVVRRKTCSRKDRTTVTEDNGALPKLVEAHCNGECLEEMGHRSLATLLRTTELRILNLRGRQLVPVVQEAT
jgi:hypothetical protein